MAAVLTGQCHCGNVTVALRTTIPIDALPVRACACTFCRKHGARTTSDPGGALTIAARDPDAVLRYEFALRTAQFLCCAGCGVYAAAVIEHGGRRYATLNVNVLDDAPALPAAAQPHDYGGETAAQRTARRVARWTPCTLAI